MRYFAVDKTKQTAAYCSAAACVFVRTVSKETVRRYSVSFNNFGAFIMSNLHVASSGRTSTHHEEAQTCLLLSACGIKN